MGGSARTFHSDRKHSVASTTGENWVEQGKKKGDSLEKPCHFYPFLPAMTGNGFYIPPFFIDGVLMVMTGE
jgi:hypothetical protein